MGDHPFAGTPQYEQQYRDARIGNGLGRVSGRVPLGTNYKDLPIVARSREWVTGARVEWPETVSLDDFRQGRPLIDLERIDPDQLAA